jgi:uncharacterized membrane protein YhaH (DUF805 family)
MPSGRFRRIAFILVPLVIAIIGLEVGMLRITLEPELAVGEIVCGVLIVLVIARALLRR